MPESEMTATSVVPPPMSTTMLPEGSVTRRPAPNRLFVSDREGGAFSDLGDLDVFEWLVSVEDESDVIAGVPPIALLEFLEQTLRALLENHGVFLVRAFFADVAQQVVPIATENGGDTDVACTLGEVVLADFARADPNDQFVADRGVLVDRPRGTVHLGIKRDREVLQNVLQFVG
jgi:hypothetical protein